MDPVKEAQLARATGLSPLLALLPIVQGEVDKLQAGLVKAVLASVKNRTLTPEAAFAAWMEFSALESVVVRLKQRAAQGRSDAEDLSDLLTGPVRRR